MQTCPLCEGFADIFFNKDFFRCTTCKGIFRSPTELPSPEKEKKRYELHQNNPENSGYREFVKPLAEKIIRSFMPRHKGLDFGSGPEHLSAVSAILKEHSYQINQFDPFFHNNPEVLSETYDFIICCEVAEHFHQPAREFHLLKNLLREGGSLFCMTNIYTPETDFGTWYYKNDFTHVFFYCEETFNRIKQQFGFSSVIIEGNIAELKS